MSNIKLSGNPSGTGSLTIAAPNTNSDYTLTLPAESGTLVTTGGAASSLSTSGNLTFTGTAQRITGDFSNATVANRAIFQTSTVNSATVVTAIPNGTNQIASFAAFNSADTGNASWGDIRATTSEVAIRSSITGTGTYLPMTFYTNGSEQMRLTSTGLGIGTSSPAAKLDVSGNIAITGASRRILGTLDGTHVDRVLFQTSTTNANTSVGAVPNGTGTNANFVAYGAADPTNAPYAQLVITSSDGQFRVDKLGTGTYLPMAFYTGGSERARIDSSGNVGIGTSSPSRLLQLNSTLPVLQLTNPTTGTTANDGTLLYQNAANFTIEQQDNGYVNVLTGGSERMRLDSSGNLLVGTTSNSLGGRVASNGVGSSGGTCFSATGYGDGIGYAIRCQQSTTNAVPVQFLNSGGTQIGTISTTNTGTAYNTSSDYRLKENIQPMTGALAKVTALKPCTYTWKSTGEADEGFIAHELQEICPSAVTGEKDAVDAEGNPVYQGIDTSFLVATLTAAIQEQQAIIQTLTTRIAALEAK